MSQLVQTIITGSDPNFASKHKILSERKQLEEPVYEKVKSEKKCITITKSELRSNQKFKERMVNSREASAEKYRENSERFPSAMKIGGKSTKKAENFPEVIEEKSEKKCEDNKENMNTNTNSKLKEMSLGTSSKMFNKCADLGMTGSKQVTGSKTNIIESSSKINKEEKSASNSKDANEVEKNKINEANEESLVEVTEDSIIASN
jgi:hypothetical protein